MGLYASAGGSRNIGGRNVLQDFLGQRTIFARYPHPKSLPSGKRLTIALAGSKSGISRCENIHGLVRECGRK